MEFFAYSSIRWNSSFDCIADCGTFIEEARSGFSTGPTFPPNITLNLDCDKLASFCAIKAAFPPTST